MYTYCNPIITVVKIFAIYLFVSIGRIAAGNVLDTVLQACVGPVYKKGLQDARQVFEAKSVDANVELDLLRR